MNTRPRDGFYARIGIAVLLAMLLIAALAVGLPRARNAPENHLDPDRVTGLIHALDMRRYAVSPPPPSADGKPQRFNFLLEKPDGTVQSVDTGVRVTGKKAYFFLWDMNRETIRYSFDSGTRGGFANPIRMPRPEEPNRQFAWGWSGPVGEMALNLACGAEMLQVTLQRVMTAEDGVDGSVVDPVADNVAIRIVAVPEAPIPNTAATPRPQPPSGNL